MLIRYLMIFILALFVFGTFILYRKKRHKFGGYASFVIIMYGLGFTTMIYVLHMIIFTDEYKLQALSVKNQEAVDTQVYIHSILADTREIEMGDITVSKGKWLYDGDYYIYDASFEDISEAICIRIPVGADRKIVVSKGAFCGILKVEYRDVFRKSVDLYSSGGGIFEIELPKSEAKKIIADRLAKIFIYFILLCIEGIIVLFLVEIIFPQISRYFKEKRLKYFFWMLTGFFLMYLQEMKLPEENVNGNYQNVFWFENYELGYLSRGLIGELVNTISPYWTEKQLFLMKSCFALLFFVIVSLCVACIMSKWNDEWMVLTLIGLFVTFPFTRLLFADDIRSDIVLLTLYVVSVIILFCNHFTIFLLPLFVIFLILINETTCLTLFPSICALILYRYMKDRRKTDLILLGIISVTGVITTLITAKFGKGGDIPLETTYMNLQVHFEGKLDKSALAAEYWTLHDHLKLIYSTFLENWITWIVFGLVLVPGILFLISLFRATYDKCRIKDNKWECIGYVILMICGLSPVSAMMIAIDYPRYMLLICVILFSDILFVLESHQEQIEIKEMNIIEKEQRSLNVWPVCVVIFYATIHTFSATIESSLSHIVAWVEYLERY